MKRDVIRWYKFKSSDKKRPILILSRDSALEYLGEVTVAPILLIQLQTNKEVTSLERLRSLQQTGSNLVQAALPCYDTTYGTCKVVKF